MKLLIDMNLSPRWVEAFRSAEFDAEHWSTIGSRSASDAEIMAFAHQHDCIVITNDLDFGDMLAANNGQKPSVVQIRCDDLRPEYIARQVIAALTQMRAELVEGALITVDPKRVRLRLLPLSRRKI